MHPIIVYLAVGTLVSAIAATQWVLFWWLTALLLVLLITAIVDASQSKQTIRRNFPLIGRVRWYIEAMRPFIRQYLIESDIDGAPINRMFRSVVYQRAKGDRDSVPFGTKVDVYRDGYEWISHSLNANNINALNTDMRVTIGGPDCQQPYAASIFNISAMSFGSLSANAIEALNAGAAKGGFYHNTGEGGISPYHLKHGADLVWQIGTGYFGCRDEDGFFNPLMFEDKAHHSAVKMIEIKLSQGAKPGHGGILPAEKNSAEIAAIRHVPAHTQVDSPPTHSAFSTPIELLHFIQQLRQLSGGKPIGFKLCIGRESEFVSICKAMIDTGIVPDFITVDGGEGGTGAAPLEYSNSIGMPLRDALAFVCDVLTGFNLKKDIKIITSGKILSAFHLVKNLALGADLCNSARANMIALGCVQSLICNSNECPTGIATQDPKLARGLVVANKTQRVYNFHKETVNATADIIASAGLSHTSELTRSHIYRRIDQAQIRRYDEIFPHVESGCLLDEARIPGRYQLTMSEAHADSFKPALFLAWVDNRLNEVSH